MPGRERIVDTFRVTLMAVRVGEILRDRDLQRVRSLLEIIKTRFCHRFKNLLIRFLMTNTFARVQIPTCKIFITIERCGCESECSQAFVMSTFWRAMTYYPRLLDLHLAVIPEQMLMMEFKRDKARAQIEAGVFYETYKVSKPQRVQN